jgi:hypothetical protein
VRYIINVVGGRVTDYEVPTIREGDIIRFVSSHYDELVAVVPISSDHRCPECPFHHSTGNLCPLHKGMRLCPTGLIFVRASDTMEEL